jgi:hypothetical protein
MSSLKTIVPDVILIEPSIIAAGHSSPPVKAVGVSQIPLIVQFPVSDPPQG